MYACRLYADVGFVRFGSALTGPAGYACSMAEAPASHCCRSPRPAYVQGPQRICWSPAPVASSVRGVIRQSAQRQRTFRSRHELVDERDGFALLLRRFDPLTDRLELHDRALELSRRIAERDVIRHE